VPAKAKKRPASGQSPPCPPCRLEAERVHPRGAGDRGRHTINADATVKVLERLVAERGVPANIRADNAPELSAWALREWYRPGLY
jgi:hypothetical protein